MFCPVPLPFDIADQTCRTHGLRLARVDSQDVGWVLDRASALNLGHHFIGASDEAGEGQWRWLDGELFWVGRNDGMPAYDGAFEHWAEFEPNGLVGENCVVVLPDGHWNDVICDMPHGYVCKAY